MEFSAKLTLAARAVASQSALIRAGATRRAIASQIDAGRLVRLRRGWYVDAEAWNSLLPEAQHLAALRAARLSAQAEQTYSHRSAATLHDLPVWSDWMRGSRGLGVAERLVVHALSRGADSGSNRTVVTLHRSEATEQETTVVAGFVCTSTDRTLADLAATEPFNVVLACADTLLRREALVGRHIDEARVMAWRERMGAIARARSGMPGAPALRAIVVLADPRAESPLESVSRLRCWQLGLEPELQVPVRAENGGTLRLDFLFRGIGFFGECDGKNKYVDEEYRRGSTADEVFEFERRRHNWVSGVTGWNGVRWSAVHIVTVERFARRLREFSVPFPEKPTRAFGSEVARILLASP